LSAAASFSELSIAALSLSLLFFSLSLVIYVHILVDIHSDVERGMAEEHLQQPEGNVVVHSE
jgi:hypothetical protein